MTATRISPAGKIWIAWALATTLAWVAGGMLLIGLGYGIAEAIHPLLGEQVALAIGFCIAGGLAGAATGAVQWLVLRQFGVDTRGWIAASGIGMAISMPIAILIAVTTRPQPGILLGGPLVGGIVGLAQWLILRRHVAQAGWWVLASALGFTAFFAAAQLLGGEGREIIAVTAAGLLLGVITASALVWLMRRD
jgi:hypothetical protein